MQTLERRETEARPRPRLVWWLVAALGALLVAGIAIGAWLLTRDSNDLSAYHQHMVTNYEEAVAAHSSGDTDLIRAQFSPDATIVFRSTEIDVDAYIARLDSTGIEAYEWTAVDTLVTDNFIVGVTSAERSPGGTPTRWLTVFEYDPDTLKIVDAKFWQVGTGSP